MSDIRCDFETRSTADLRKVGAHVYFEDPTTEVICMSWAIGDGPVQVWAPGDPDPEEFLLEIQFGSTIRAFNCNFERLCFEHIMGPRYGWPVPPLRQWRDTMAKARVMALPGSLENAAPAAGIEQRKDDAGRRLMMQMTKPRSNKNGKIVWWDAPEKVERLKAYCAQDTVVERELDKRLLDLIPFEQDYWYIHSEMNDRGVYVDQHLCRQAEKVAQAATLRLNARVSALTDYEITSCSNRNQVLNFVRKHGLDVESIAKDELEDILVQSDIPPIVRSVLELRQESAKTSVAKIRTLLQGTSRDGRAKGLLMYHAASTGRDGGRRLQPQNLPKPANKDVETAIEAVLTGDAEYVEMLYGSALVAVADTIRGMICAEPGAKIMAADYNAIEARVLAWMAGQNDLVSLFSSGGKVYETMAARVYGVPVEQIQKGDPRRNLGKVAVLGCGYGMGGPKFQATCHKQGIHIDLEMATKTVGIYREANAAIKAYWSALEEAAISAVMYPGQSFCAGAVRFKKSGSFLMCRLPSGRPIFYPYPSIKERPTPWGEERAALHFWGEDPYTRKWSEMNTYGGSLANNVVQGTARDVLVWSIVRLRKYGYPAILQVHDEIVCEVPEGHGSIEEMERIMCDLPAWAKGLPVAAEGFEDRRYRK